MFSTTCSKWGSLKYSLRLQQVPEGLCMCILCVLCVCECVCACLCGVIYQLGWAQVELRQRGGIQPFPLGKPSSYVLMGQRGTDLSYDSSSLHEYPFICPWSSCLHSPFSSLLDLSDLFSDATISFAASFSCRLSLILVFLCPPWISFPLSQCHFSQWFMLSRSLSW